MKRVLGYIVIIACLICLFISLDCNIYDELGDAVYEGNMTGFKAGINYASGDASVDFNNANKVVKPETQTGTTKYYDSFKKYWTKSMADYAWGRKTAQGIFNEWMSLHKDDLKKAVETDREK